MFWAVIVIGFAVAVLATHNYRSPSQSSSGARTPAETVTKGGNLGFTGSNQTETVECDGGDLSVSGEQNTIDIAGHCATISVGGTHNAVTGHSADTVILDGSSDQDKVFIDSVDTINAAGRGNTVVYYMGSPHVTNTGTGNDIHFGFAH